MNGKNETNPNKSTPNGTPSASQRYYAVTSSKKPESPNDRICTNIKQVNELIKEFKNARFKPFAKYEEALNFLLSVEYSETDLIVDKLADNIERLLFFEPSGREFNQIKSDIENGTLSGFCDKITKNPRFIIDANDLPPIIQRAFRYDIVHVACAKNRLDILMALFDSIESKTALRRLYPSSTDDLITMKTYYVLDRYLNSPEKGNCETPLHLASKFGYTEIISFLLTHPKTDKTLKNKQQLTAKQIICSRCKTSESHVQEIRALFNAEYYVAFVNEDDELQFPKLISPLKINSPNGLSPNSKIRGLAGPTSSETAKSLTKIWRENIRTPPQNPLTDVDRSWHQTGRDVTRQMNLSWMEYWHFLECYEDLQTTSGLQMMEVFLIKKLILNIIPYFTASETNDIEDCCSVCSDDSFITCCSELAEETSPYENLPQLIPWGNNTAKRVRFHCCGSETTSFDGIHIYMPLSLQSIANVTECRVQLQSNSVVLTNAQLIKEVKDMLTSWRICLDKDPRPFYRCNDILSTYFTLKSVSEIVFLHTDVEIRIHFPVSNDFSEHLLMLFIDSGCEEMCKVTSNYIGGDMPSSEDLDAFDVLSDIVINPAIYPLVDKWRNSMKHCGAI